MMRRVRIIGFVLALALLAPALLSAARQRALLRYNLKPGDHLVYREVFERDARNPRFNWDFKTRSEWTSHVLVVATEDNDLIVGFQRNQVKNELLRFEPNGQDRLHERMPRSTGKEDRRASYFAEANRITPDGWPRLPWQAQREAWSELLFDLHEIVPLPLEAVVPGDTWQAPSLLGLSFRAVGWEKIKGEKCLAVEGKADGESGLRLRYWFCTQSGALQRLKFEGSYEVVGGRFAETLTLELLEARHNEKLATWLADPKLQSGSLAALLASDRLLLAQESLYSLLDGATDDTRRMVLSLAYRHRLAPPSLQRVIALLRSEDPRLRTLVVRVLDGAGKKVARPLVEKALDDADYFVRDAALDWVRNRLPARAAMEVETVEDARARWKDLAEMPLEPPLNPLEVQLAGAGTDFSLPAAVCSDTAEWTAYAVRGRHFPPEIPGTTIRGMTTPGHYGWPYIVHIPEDYRGDEPFPLLIFLSGDMGRSIHGVGYSRETLPNLGYVVVFPHAQNFWWRAEPTAHANALLTEVQQEFNIDPNRVYLVGSSNGGTATIRFSAHWSDRLAASVSMMGAGLRSADDAEPPLVVNLLQLPLLLLHGEDDKTIQAQADRELLEALRQLNPKAPVSLHIFPGRGHDIIFDTDEGLTQPFLEQHVRNPFPRTVVFQTADMRFPRRFWLEILEKEKGLAEVQGVIGKDNTIHVDTHGVKRLRLLLRPELLPRPGPVRVMLDGKEVFQGDLPHDCALLQQSWQRSADPFLAYSAELTFNVQR